MSAPAVLAPEFALDQFQIDAIDAIDAGSSVLVSAPTGAGKTLIAEHAIGRALSSGRRAFYTTPVKALSNQKFNDLVALHGKAQVGLLTGDNSIQPDAPVVVMTTEILRNMIYENDRRLSELSWVILDEVHYLADHYRGAIWEEILISTPEHVRFVCLSATISNSEEFGEWLAATRGDVAVITTSDRPVPLKSLHMVTDTKAGTVVFPPLDGKGNPHPNGKQIERKRHANIDEFDDIYDERPAWRYHSPDPRRVIAHLQKRGMLPALFFIFSRDGCDQAARTAAAAQSVDITPAEQHRIAEIAHHRLSALTAEERTALKVDEWVASIQTGVASHHAGLVPVFKETVEQAFIEGLIKVVFATETLAIGMNMPARTAVIARLTKYNGTGHDYLTPLQYTQIIGRAGRRGIDTEGHAITLWSPHVPFAKVAELSKSRSFRLVSAFRPHYNMAANLINRFARNEAEALLSRCYAQFQRNQQIQDKTRGWQEQRKEHAEDLRIIDEAPAVVAEYMNLLKRALPYLRSESGRLKRGAVIADMADPTCAPVLVFVDKAIVNKTTFLRFIASDGTPKVLHLSDITSPFQIVGWVDVPAELEWSSSDLAGEVTDNLHQGTKLKYPSSKRWKAGSPPRLLAMHPLNNDPLKRQRLVAAESVERRGAALDKRERRILSESKANNTVVTDFQSIVRVLEQRGHLADWRLTDSGSLLSSVYHENDLLLAEALYHGCFTGLSDPELAAVVSVLTHEQRPRDTFTAPAYPSTGRSLESVTEIHRLHASLTATERKMGLTLTRPLSTGFFNHAYAWASGATLEAATGQVIIPGDFIRHIKMMADLLRQISKAATDPALARQARQVLRLVVRGIVATDSSWLPTAAPDQDALPEHEAAAPEHTGGSPALTTVLTTISSAKQPDPHRRTFSAPFPQRPNPVQPTDYNLSEMKVRGWTPAVIRDLLGKPDRTKRNPRYKRAAAMLLYSIDRVHEAEQSDTFAEHIQRREARAAARRQAKADQK